MSPDKEKFLTDNDNILNGYIVTAIVDVSLLPKYIEAAEKTNYKIRVVAKEGEFIPFVRKMDGGLKYLHKTPVVKDKLGIYIEGFESKWDHHVFYSALNSVLKKSSE
ncbi:MAG: hypothetical protein A3B38_01060 [Candidatus Levybacteria bacterium RIFCSPLOWO2_01_FULL_36_13]|nr:MAG: hypothetical protein A2684_02300 [Candidatus Levybacteria bacterium RIFCSPHIGHO2_01_FULL_36_15b]OGH35476.1 MAG: hypothetical protein A3B38_01060 [Candidatus Levybacteria bacterium RIFCSPLOWO2_01_FULL_36_13]